MIRFFVLLLMSAASFAGDAKRIPGSAELLDLSTTKTVTPSSLISQHDLTIVQLWASWCAGCGPVMADLSKRVAQGSAVGLVSISIDEDLDSARSYFNAKPTDIKAAMSHVLLDSAGQKFAKPLGIKNLPILLIVNRDGVVLQTMQGHPSREQLDQALLTFGKVMP